MSTLRERLDEIGCVCSRGKDRRPCGVCRGARIALEMAEGTISMFHKGAERLDEETNKETGWDAGPSNQTVAYGVAVAAIRALLATLEEK